MPPSKRLSESDLRPFYNLPMAEACKQLGVCETVLKKYCRRIGIRRWPHRVIKSVEKLIANMEKERAVLAASKQDGADGTVEQIEKKIESLKKGREFLLTNPADFMSVITEDFKNQEISELGDFGMAADKASTMNFSFPKFKMFSPASPEAGSDSSGGSQMTSGGRGAVNPHRKWSVSLQEFVNRNVEKGADPLHDLEKKKSTEVVSDSRPANTTAPRSQPKPQVTTPTSSTSSGYNGHIQHPHTHRAPTQPMTVPTPYHPHTQAQASYIDTRTMYQDEDMRIQLAPIGFERDEDAPVCSATLCVMEPAPAFGDGYWTTPMMPVRLN
eukprot:GFYU01000225.1.p1 GENE.GFYU01000225.1~~GFYU01000225.1.p1  ORF type:complete len:348 (+),score=103.39 GFYU01000225.1:66-1046(+)